MIRPSSGEVKGEVESRPTAELANRAGGRGDAGGTVPCCGSTQGTVPFCEVTQGTVPLQSASPSSCVAFTQSVQFSGSPIGRGSRHDRVSAFRKAMELQGQSSACFTSWPATGLASTYLRTL